jgi:hypothetical protein
MIPSLDGLLLGETFKLPSLKTPINVVLYFFLKIDQIRMHPNFRMPGTVSHRGIHVLQGSVETIVFTYKG